MLEYIILGSLYRKAQTGYDIRKCIEGGIGMFYKASYGSIYPLLSRLLTKGFVTCSNEVEGKREKKKYSITEFGREAFLQWLKEDEDNGGSMESFMARVFYYDLLPSDIVHIKISKYEDKLIDYYNSLLEKKEKYESLDNREGFYYKLSTLYFGICKLQSIITWCETVKNRKDLDTLVQKLKGRNSNAKY